jgi:nucleotide-binding universal stress UspA family protein
MNVLFAYDGSENADAAIAVAAAILDPHDVEAVVLSVWEPFAMQALRTAPFGGEPAVPLDVPEVDEQSRDRAEQLAEHGARLAREHGYNARGVSVADKDDVAGTIVATADELDVDLIVLGARGLAGVRAFLGSVSTHVVQHAQRPVLVVPAKSSS